MRGRSLLPVSSALLVCAFHSPTAEACNIDEYSPYTPVIPDPAGYLWDLRFGVWMQGGCPSVAYTLGTESGTATEVAYFRGDTLWLFHSFVGDLAGFKRFVGSAQTLDATATWVDPTYGDTRTGWTEHFELDFDRDGVVRSAPDCNDDDPAVGTVAPTYYRDIDGDGWGDDLRPAAVCSPPVPGLVTRAGDCEPRSATVHPEAYEICGNGIDENCDGVDGYDPAVDASSVCWAYDRRIDGVKLYTGAEISGGFAGTNLQVGDLDGDGTADLVSDQYIVLGPPPVISGVNRAITLSAGRRAPVQIVSVGDADGDGQDDAAVYDYNDTAYLLYGPIVSNRTTATADVTYLADADTTTGADVDIVPDVDGDGLADVVIGAPGIGGAPDYPGAVYVVSGSETGGVEAWASATYTYNGGPGDFLGTTTALGDMNGDGLEDIAIASVGAVPISIVEGGATPGAYVLADVAVATLLEADYGGYGSDQWLPHLSSADYDGDGTPDLLVGNASRALTPDAKTGLAYAFVGPLAGPLAAADAYTTWHSSAVGASDNLPVGMEWGGALVAGDLDADGSTDVLLGTPTSGPNSTQGGAFLQLGPAGGTVEVDTLIAFRSPTTIALFGSGGAFVPDWSGDGIPELAIGSRLAEVLLRDGTTRRAGSVYVLESDNWSF